MAEIRTILPIDAALALPALRELRPHAPALADAVTFKAYLRDIASEQYQLVGVFSGARPEAECVAGYRIMHMLYSGKIIYVDDLSTLPEARGKGYAGALLKWLDAEALRLGCAAVHLDSGVSEARFTAHRQYLKHGMNITCHHFEKRLA